MKALNWLELNSRSYAKPTVILVDFGSDTGPLYCVAGCDYGYLHNTSGNVRTWLGKSGATKARNNYIAMKAGE